MTEEQKQELDPSEIEATEQESVQQDAGNDVDTRITDLEEQLATAKDQVLRATAEMQNIRRRAEQEVQKAHKFALEKFAIDLLPIIDSLERGIELSSANTQDDNLKAMREGMELTLKMFQDTLKRFQIEEVYPVGEPFNPDTQEAMAMEENPETEPNTVIKVFQKGYLINGRLLRPAMVVVSK